MNRMIYGASLFALLAQPAWAQVYIATQYPAPYVPLTGGTNILFTNPDDGASTVPIGFVFNFYGVDYTHVNVGVNGTLSFATPCSPSTPCRRLGSEVCTANVCQITHIMYDPASGLPNADEPHASVSPWWDDMILDPFAAPLSTITHGIVGTAPNREFVVEWGNIRHYVGFQAGTVSRTSYQVRLSEGSGSMRLAYGTYFSDPGDDFEWQGILGIENATGTEGVVPLPCAIGANTCDFTSLQSLQNQVIEISVPSAVELVGVVTAPTGADPGTEIQVPVEVRNLGPLAGSTPFSVEVYLSADLTITGADALLGTLEFASIGPSSSEMQTLTATVDAATLPGYYYIGAIIDSANTIMEPVENNNIAISSGLFLVGADVLVQIDDIPSTGPSETITFPIRLQNQGSALASVEWSVYLSTNPTFGMGDVLIASGNSALPAVPETIVDVTATIPNTVVPGDYYFVVVVDPANLIIEADETNNESSTSMATELTGPDLVSQAIDGDAFVFRGELYTVELRLANLGPATARDFYVSFHLSDNQLVTITDYLIGETGPLTLGPGEVRELSATYTISATVATGLYYLGVIADNRTVILEAIETNNVRFNRDQVMVRDVAPDFISFDIDLPTNGAAGESIPISRTLANSGNAAGMVEYSVILSADQLVDPATDYELARLTLPLGERTEAYGTENIRIPARVPGGNYYVGFILDPANVVSELFEDNNVTFSEDTISIIPAQLTILTRELPILTRDLPFSFVFAAAGGAGAYTWTVEGGMLPAGLALDPSGRLTGTPTEEGRSTVTIAVSDGSLSVSRDFDVLVAEQHAPLEIATRSLIPAFVGREYSYPLTGFGGVPPYKWSSDRPMPDGMIFTEDGVITGVPVHAALDTIDFTVTDETGESATRPLVIRVVEDDAAVRFTTDVLPDGTLGETYDEDVRVETGTGESPFVFEVAAGSLPPGLMLQENRISGVPTLVGEFRVTIRVVDNRGDYDLNLFIITINEDAGITITTTSLPPAIEGTEYKDELDAPVRVKAFSSGRGSAEITFALVSGELPPGLMLATDGTLSGTPSTAGVYPFLVQANDDAGQRDLRALGIVVDVPVVEPPTTVIDDGCTCSSSSTAGGSFWALLLIGALVALRRRGWLLVFAVALAPAVAEAQMFGPYLLSTRSEAYVSRSGGTTIPWTTNDDDQAIVTMPFAFKFYEQTYTDVSIGTNGIISFSVQDYLGSFGETIPSQFEPNAYISAFQDDLVIGGGTTHVEGVAPHRVFIIQFENVERYNAANGTTAFQWKLFEGAGGKIELAYGVADSINPNDWSASAGIENADGSDGFYFFGCANNCDGSQLDTVENTVVVAQQDAGTDVFAGGINAPPVVYSGVRFDVDLTVFSLHANALGPFRYVVHLAGVNEEMPDNVIYTSPFTTLLPYQQIQVTTSTAVPLNTPEGRYRLALEVDSDNAINEPDENNFIFSDEIRVAPPQPDFQISEVTPGSSTAMPGDTVNVLVSFENAGNLDGAAKWALYLSRNNVVSVDDLEVSSGAVTLPLLTTSSITVPITVPETLMPGVYWVGAVIDAEDQVRELSDVNNIRVSAQPLSIAADTVTITTTTLPGGYVGVDYDTYLVAVGGNGDYTWSIEQGTLPDGLSFIGSTGEIRGTPTSAGEASLQVKVVSDQRTATADLTIRIEDVNTGLVILTRELLPGLVGNAYPPSEQKLVASGGSGPITFSLDNIAPAGLVLDPDGLLHGTPEERGVFELRVRATDGTTTAARTILLTIAEPGRLALIAAVLPDGVIGETYDYVLRTIGHSATATLTFSTDDPRPPGVDLSQDGRISGVPEVEGSWRMSVLVVEGDPVTGPRDTATFILTVVSEPGFRINPTTLPDAEEGAMYNTTLIAIGGRPPFAWRISGELPPDMTSVVETAMDMRESLVIRGTPLAPGFTTVLVTVDDAVGRRATASIALRVLPKPEPERPMPQPEGCSCASERGTGGWGNAAVLGLIVAIFGRRRRGSR